MYDIQKIIDSTNPPKEHGKELLEKSLEIYKKIHTTPRYSAIALAEVAVFLAYESLDLAVSRHIIKPKFTALNYARKTTGMHVPEALERVAPIFKKLNLGNGYDDIPSRAKELLVDYRETHNKEYYNGTPSITAAAAIKLASEREGKPIKDTEFTEHLGYARHNISRRSKELAHELGFVLGNF